MPRVSSFRGITIAMYYNDHAPPHFHVKYAEHEATVLEWAVLHRRELMVDWELARLGARLRDIEPLP